MTPRILAITNEDPGWPEADKQQADDAWRALVSGMAEEGYEPLCALVTVLLTAMSPVSEAVGPNCCRLRATYSRAASAALF